MVPPAGYPRAFCVGRGGVGDGFSQVFDAQKLAGLTRTGPCRAARARATPTAAAAKVGF